MIPKPNVIAVLSCWLTLGVCMATQAADMPLAPERTELSPPAHTAMEGDGVKREDDTKHGIKTIKGEVFRVKGQHFYVRQSDGKEMHLHAKPTTQMKGELKKGDRIEVEMDDEDNALLIRKTK